MICSQLLIINAIHLKNCKDQIPPRITEAKSIPTVSLTQCVYYYFCKNLFENADLEGGKNEEEWKKTTRSDTMNSSFPSSGSFKDFPLVLRSAFPRNEIRAFPALLTKVQREEPSQGLFPFCSSLQGKS